MADLAERTVRPDNHDSSQRLLQEFTVRNAQRAHGRPALRILSLKGGPGAEQCMYSDLTQGLAGLAPESWGKATKATKVKEDEDEDEAAGRIQARFRGRAGRKEFERRLKESESRERAATRVQCAWRRKSGYSKFLLQRARNYEEGAAAVRLQSLIRARSDRKRFLHKRAFMSERELMATRIQCSFR